MKQKRNTKHKPWYLVMAWLLTTGNLLVQIAPTEVQAESCPDVKIVFARGSGGERWTTEDYLSFRSAIEKKLATIGLSYESDDLDYPAVGVGIENIGTALGAFFSGGESYEFGESVNTGVQNIISMVNDAGCPETKYVFGGYSQGAMVVSKSLGSLDAEKVIYAATFGNPKTYLPEGKGLIPAACRGENLSDYRMYVPDCRAYTGLLGAYIPYEPVAYEGKVGIWCNKRDIMCSSHLGLSDHVGYVADGLYEDASRVIIDKITAEFGIKNELSSPHDTVILIDSTASMSGMIEKYKAEAQRLAKETLENGGRVALYDYRDLRDPYKPVKHCDFTTCTMEVFENELMAIKAGGGGDRAESLLSASFTVMNELEWKYGSTKSLVVLTDAEFLSPDRDGTAFDAVVKLSKEIDPVNFYIITNASMAGKYEQLANETGGKVVTNLDELSLLTDYIIGRYDALPRVEESDISVESPTISFIETRQTGAEAVTINCRLGENTTGAIVVVNDTVLGLIDDKNANENGELLITIDGLKTNRPGYLSLIPINDDRRGDGIVIDLSHGNDGFGGTAMDESTIITTGKLIPKTPNTGKA